MLGQPISMLIPRVVGFRLTGELPAATTATDLVLTITQMLRKHGVVGKFVEFYGDGVAEVPVANRATIGNMSPEFGSTCAIFPIDQATIDYLTLTGRTDSRARPGREVRQGAGPVARPEPGAAVLRAAHPRPRHGRAEHRRPQAPAGQDRPGQRQDRVQGRAARLHRRRRQRQLPRLRPRRAGGRQAHPRGQGHPRRRHRDHPRPRPRRHRRDHLLHQHLQPVRDDRRRAAGQEGGREGPEPQALGQDDARPRLQGRHGLLRARRAHPVPGQARVQPRRLRLHHLHRQLRPAADHDQRGGQRERPDRRQRPVRQPQLRGPDQPGREDELPRVPAPGRRLRPGGHDGHRPGQRAARHRPGGQPGLPEGHLAVAAGGPDRRRLVGRGGHVHHRLRRRLQRRRQLARPRSADR